MILIKYFFIKTNRKNFAYKKLIIFISSSDKNNIICQINTKISKYLKKIMPADFSTFLPSIFVPLIGLVTPAVFIVLIGRFITATD